MVADIKDKVVKQQTNSCIWTEAYHLHQMQVFLFMNIKKIISNYDPRRTFGFFTEENAKDVLNLTFGDIDAFGGPSVNDIKLSTKSPDIVDGTVSFGGGETYEFEIRSDARVSCWETKFDENSMQYVTNYKRNLCHSNARVVFYLMEKSFIINI